MPGQSSVPVWAEKWSRLHAFSHTSPNRRALAPLGSNSQAGEALRLPPGVAAGLLIEVAAAEPAAWDHPSVTLAGGFPGGKSLIQRTLLRCQSGL